MNSPTEEPTWLRRALIAFAFIHVTLMIILPFASVIAQACSEGFATFTRTFSSRDTIHAIKLTLLIALIAVPINTLFGIAIAWGFTHVKIPGKRVLMALLDLPFSISPVVVGFLFILLLGKHGLFGGWLEARGIKIIFAFPGLLIVTLFVTMPYVAKELIPLMDGRGREEEEAARLLGAGWWRIFWKITFPEIKWGLLYGIILCTARSMGEFGAVAVVSGNIRGRTNTLPLHVEALFQDGDLPAASAAASVLAILGIVSLVARTITDIKAKAKSKN